MKAHILTSIFSIFGENNIETVMHYGNKQGEDIDIFVIVYGDIEYNCMHHNKLDITYVGSYHVNEMIACFDPLLTDPILTGEMIFGDSNKIIHKLNKCRASKKTIAYLRKKAIQFFQWGEIHFMKGDFNAVCDCIRFSTSFCCFADYYGKKFNVISFLDIIGQYPNEFELVVKAKRYARSKKNIPADDIRAIMEQTRQILTCVE